MTLEIAGMTATFLFAMAISVAGLAASWWSPAGGARAFGARRDRTTPRSSAAPSRASREDAPPLRPPGHEQRMVLRQEAELLCALVEDAPSYRREQFVPLAWSRLTAVLAEAILLPALEPESEDVLAGGPTHEEWRVLAVGLRALFGDRDAYRTTWAPYGAESPTAGHGSLADDLAGVWRDLRDGLDALAAGTASEADVLWEWRFGFEHHWGRHAVEATRALHAVLAER